MLDFEKIRKELEIQRENKRLSELSRISGIEHTALRRLSHGNQDVRFRTVKQISDFLEQRETESET